MFILITLLLCLMLFLKRRYSTTNIAIITKSGKVYYVNKTTDITFAKEKAEMLEKIDENINKLLKLLKISEHKNDVGVKKLLNNWSGYIDELDKYESKNIFAYNVNKGEQISVCLENKQTNKLNSENEIMYVVLHELSHVMTNDYAHNKQFWDQFEFLISFASKHNIYNEIDYRKTPKPFCNSYLNTK